MTVHSSITSLCSPTMSRCDHLHSHHLSMVFNMEKKMTTPTLATCLPYSAKGGQGGDGRGTQTQKATSVSPPATKKQKYFFAYSLRAWVWGPSHSPHPLLFSFFPSPSPSHSSFFCRIHSHPAGKKNETGADSPNSCVHPQGLGLGTQSQSPPIALLSSFLSDSQHRSSASHHPHLQACHTWERSSLLSSCLSVSKHRSSSSRHPPLPGLPHLGGRDGIGDGLDDARKVLRNMAASYPGIVTDPETTASQGKGKISKKRVETAKLPRATEMPEPAPALLKFFFPLLSSPGSTVILQKRIKTGVEPPS